MADQPRISLGLIGAGNMGALHARVIGQSERARLAYICDPDEGTARRLGDRTGARWGLEPETLDACDAWVVASPTATHHGWATTLIEAGRPVLVEKPVSEELAEVEDLVSNAHATGIPLMCGFIERFNPVVKTALEIIKEPVYFASIRHSPYVSRIRSGVGGDLLIHDIDLAIRFLGRPPSSCAASFSYAHPDSDPGAEDVAEARLRFPGSGLAALSASRLGQRKVRRLEISDLEKLVELDLVRRDITVYRHVPTKEVEDAPLAYRQETVIDIPVIVDGREPLAAQLDRFLDLASGAADPVAEWDSILPPHEVLAAIIDSAHGDEGARQARS